MDLNKLRFVVYRFNLGAEDRFHMPPFVGSTLRGAFGSKLKGICCISRGRSCPDCVIHPGCVYAYLFETTRYGAGSRFTTISDIPRPFIISPLPSDNPATIRFDLTLIGDAIEASPHVILTFLELQKSGLGPRRDRFTLRSVSSLSSQGEQIPIYQAGDPGISYEWFTFTHKDLSERAESLPDERTMIRLLSPLRVKFKGKLVTDLEFHHLIRAISRRLSLICTYHCGFDMDVDFNELFSLAERVERERSDLKWVDLERFSGRQRTRMKMGGLTGEVRFRGELRPFKLILSAGERLHAGKGCVMGLGKMEVVDGDIMEGPSGRDGDTVERGTDRSDALLPRPQTGGKDRRV